MSFSHVFLDRYELKFGIKELTVCVIVLTGGSPGGVGAAHRQEQVHHHRTILRTAQVQGDLRRVWPRVRALRRLQHAQSASAHGELSGSRSHRSVTYTTTHSFNYSISICFYYQLFI